MPFSFVFFSIYRDVCEKWASLKAELAINAEQLRNAEQKYEETSSECDWEMLRESEMLYAVAEMMYEEFHGKYIFPIELAAMQRDIFQKEVFNEM